MSKRLDQERRELILGIYTPLEWHEMKKPKKKDLFPGCPVCRSLFKSDYQKWYRQKRNLLKQLV